MSGRRRRESTGGGAGDLDRTGGPDPGEVRGRVVLITGAASGIGRSLAGHLTNLGADVVALDRDPLDQTPAALRLRADITDPTDVADAVRRAIDAYARIDVLINNAAVTDVRHRPVRDLPPERWEAIFRVNVTGTLRVTQAVLRPMLERRLGTVVFITSSLGQPRGGIPGDAVYSASKAAVEMLAWVLAQETREAGLNVVTLYPSVKVDTGFFADASPEERRELAPPTLLDDIAAFLAGLPPGALSGVAISQQAWDDEPGYAAALRHAAAGEGEP